MSQPLLVKRDEVRLCAYPGESRDSGTEAEKRLEIHHTVGRVFDGIEGLGVLTLQDAGAEQDEGISRVTYHFNQVRLSGSDASAPKFAACFYCRSDVDRALSTGELRLGLWAPPSFQSNGIVVASKIVVNQFQLAGMKVRWDGSKYMRPVVYLS